jgi:hypothetical protein
MISSRRVVWGGTPDGEIRMERLTDRTEDVADAGVVQSEDIPDTSEMPWQETNAMKERVRVVLEWEKRWDAGEGRMNFAELCREFGISRQVGYGWLGRYRDSNNGVQSVVERSRPVKSGWRS